ncbi:PTS system, cellobiose-specific IIC component [Bacillus cereus AH820]|uniref:PTS system, cellobiose-specific IIC component n=1 Tax=Bacillus cereus (strain AH820) TaxID=405535 RepID=B7JRI8_BACC0|nr:PTS system, cellobiose-specific IIC component [Bacillus cereus AH820]
MNGFMSFMEQKIMPTTQKIAGQRHLLAIRNGVISTLPLTIVGSFFVIFLNLPIDAYMEWIAPFRHILDIPFRFTVGLMALYAAFAGRRFAREFLSAQSIKCRVIICTRLFTSIG